MVFLLRALGWAIFGISAIVFVASGGFTAVRQGSLVAMVAGVMMPVGMLVTAMCTMVASWRRVRQPSPRRGPP